MYQYSRGPQCVHTDIILFSLLRNPEKIPADNEGDSTVASQPQVKRTEEGAQLLLPAESKIVDGAPGVNATNNSGTKLGCILENYSLISAISLRNISLLMLYIIFSRGVYS